jgi:hypothetical protein
METPTDRPADTRRVPGWERVLNAFMADPDRIRTNVELGQVPGVQAFHQRISDLTRYGYVLTSAVKLGGNGRYAYALLGVAASPGAWPHSYPRPYADDLPTVPDDPDAYADVVAAAVAKIEAKSDELTRRGAAPAVSHETPSRVTRDAAAVLALALGDDVIGDWPAADRRDVLALAKATRDELSRTRSLRALEHANGEQADELLELKAVAREAEEARQAILGYARASTDQDVQAWAEQPVTIGEAVTFLVASATSMRAAVASKPARRARQPRADRGPTGPQLMRKALEHHEQPMHTAKIAEWVLANGGDKVYKGLTPSATMAAQLATSNKETGEFVKVAPGCYGLREWATGGADGGPELDGFGNELLELDPVR